MPKLEEFMTTEIASGKKVTLGFDDNGQLYVNRKKVVTEQRVKLETWINVAIVLGALDGFA